MNTFSGKVITLFTIFVLVFSQVQPAGARQAAQDTGTATPTDEPTQTAAPTDQATQTPSPTPTLTPTPAPTEDTPDSTTDLYPITISASPAYLTAPGPVTITWSVGGQIPFSDDVVMTLQIALTDGYIPELAPNSGASYAADTETLTLPVTSDATGGQFVLDAQTPVSNISFPASLISTRRMSHPASGSGGGDISVSLSDATLALPKHEVLPTIDAPAAGESSAEQTISTTDGQTSITFSAGALDGVAQDINGQPKVISVDVGAPAGADVPATSLSGDPFEINAQEVVSHDKLHQFSSDVSLDVSYANMDLTGVNENNLSLFWYDPDTREWIELPTTVDTDSRKLHATTRHFSVFSAGINDWNATHLPTMDAFQVSQYTGAGTYSLPIEVPAGPGGLQPKLSLDYNSQVIDQSNAQTQASWVGMGWSLDTGSIELNDHGTISDHPADGSDQDYTQDDTWTLNVNGISSTIVKAGTTYHAADENFMKYSYDAASDTWRVWDKVGNIYTFAYTTKLVFDKCDDGVHKVTYRWSLTSIENVFGKQLTYDYTDALQGMRISRADSGKCPTSGSVQVATATYPTTITYPNKGYRILFKTEGRSDYKSGWTGDLSYHSYQQQRLRAIVVQQDPSGTFASPRTVRKYVFGYSETPKGTDIFPEGTPDVQIWPGLTWGAGGQTLTLLQVSQFGAGGATQLPSTSFKYGDKMHLTEADNGYGGSVQFSYDFWQADQAPKSQSCSLNFGNTNPTAAPTCAFHLITSGSGSSLSYDTQNNREKIHGTIIGHTVLPDNLYRPGGVYRYKLANLQLATPKPNTSVQMSYGLQFSDKAYGENVLDQIGNVIPGEVRLKPGAPHPITIVMKTSQVLAFTRLTFQLLPTFYRVHTKTVSDGQSNSSTFTYDYSGAAVNDNNSISIIDGSPISDSACPDTQLNDTPPTCQQYYEKYSEFRGHAKVVETGPDGRKVITVFSQDDLLKGRPASVTIEDANGKILSAQLTYYATSSMLLNTLLWYYLPPPPWRAPIWEDHPPYQGIFHNKITLLSEETRVYDADGATYHALKTDYSDQFAYDAFGNLKKKTEQTGTGTQTGPGLTDTANVSWDSVTRTTNIAYAPAVNSGWDGSYLTGLPNHQTMTDADGNKRAEAYNLYDTRGALTGVRTWVQYSDYSQVSFAYNGWGDRTGVTTYGNYATASTDPSGTPYTTTMAYDPIFHTYPISQTTPAVGIFQSGITTTWGYDDLAYGDYILEQPTSQSDANNTQNNDTTIQATYDEFGRLTNLIKPGPQGDNATHPTFHVSYNDARSGDFAQPANPPVNLEIDLRQRVSGSIYATSNRFYDGLGRMIRTVTGLADGGTSTVTTAYDAYGNVASQSTPDAGGATLATYDVLGRPLTITAPNGTGTSYYYDGLITTATDPKGGQTITKLDAWGHTKSVEPPTGPAVTYCYDLLDRLTSVTRLGSAHDYCDAPQNAPSGYTTFIDYDHAGRKTDMTDPNMGHWHYEYDPQGNLTTQTDMRGCTLRMKYDELNRLTRKYNSAGDCGTPVDTYFAYDESNSTNGIGRRTSMTDSSGSTRWMYDVRGLVTSEQKTIIGQQGISTTSWNYNSADLAATMTYPDGELVTNTYNAQMLLKTVTGTDPTTHALTQYVEDSTYDSAGRLSKRFLGNPLQGSGKASLLTQHYNFNDWTVPQQGGQLGSIQTTLNASGATLQDLAYGYDANGNISEIQDKLNNQKQQFGYDALNRLRSAQASKIDINSSTGADGLFNEAYGYDPETGNLNCKLANTTCDGVANYTYADSSHPNAVTGVTGAGGSNTYFYDANGSQATRVVNGQTYHLTYDAEGRLVKVDTTPLPTATPTRTATVTPTPTDTATASPSPTQTLTPVLSYTPSNTPTVTLTPTVTNTATLTLTPTLAPTLTLTQTPTPTATKTATMTATVTITNTPTITPTAPPAFVTISGEVGVPGTIISYQGGAVNGTVTTTGAYGDYQFQVPYLWSGVVTPTLIGVTFSPTSKSYTNVTNVLYGQNYGANGTVTLTSIGTEDGHILYNTSLNAGGDSFVLGDSAGDIGYRAILSFATGGALPDGATVQSAVLKIKQYGSNSGNNPFTTMDKLYVDIATGYFGTVKELELADFNATGTVGQVAIIDATPTNGWYSNSITFNGPGRNAINKAGRTQLRLRFNTVTTNNSTADYMRFASGDNATASIRPQLIINYIVPALPLAALPNTIHVASAPLPGQGKLLSAASLPGNLYLAGFRPQRALDDLPTPTATPTATLTPDGSTATPTPTPTLTGTPTNAPTSTVTPTTTPTPAPSFTTADFTYDGNGNMVKMVINNTITAFYVGPHYQIVDGNTTKYYFAGSQRVAMRTNNGAVLYLLGEHLGSTSVTTDDQGNVVGTLNYKAQGETRSSTGSTPTDNRYTGQRENANLGLYYYGARWYDPALGRFAQADTIVTGAGAGSSATINGVANDQYTPLTTGYYEPAVLQKLNQDNAFLLAKGGLLNLTDQDKQQGHIVDVPLDTQALDRYAYADNNPLGRTDPTGHKKDDNSPLCAPEHPNCKPLSDRVWSPAELRKIIASLRYLRDLIVGAIAILTGTTILTGVLGGVIVSAIAGLSGAELAWEYYNLDTFITYLIDALGVAEREGGVRISIYRYPIEYGGIPYVIYYEGAITPFYTTSFLLEFMFAYEFGSAK